MKWNNIRHKEWWKNFLTGVLATAIGVGLTFEVNNRVEHHKQKQAQFQTAMIAVYDIDEIVRHFLEDKKREDAFFKVAMYLYTHQDELETVAMDSLWMAASYLVYDPTEIPEWTDDSSEKVFTRYFTEYLESAFGEVIVHMDVDVPDAFKKQFVIGSFIHTVKWWIGKGLKEKPEKIIDSYMKCLPGKNE